MTAEPEPLPSERPAETSSLPVRYARVFVAPARLFDELARRPRWVGALLLVVALSVLANLLLPTEILREVLAARAPAEATPEQVAGMAELARWWVLGAALFVPPVVIALVAALLILIYDFLLAGEASYRQLVAATAHAYLIWGTGQLVTLGLVVLAGDPEVTLSLHLLAPFLEAGGYLQRLLRGLSVFGLWTAAVLGVAVSRIYPGRRAGSAAALLVGLYVLFQAVGAAVAGAFG